MDVEVRNLESPRLVSDRNQITDMRDTEITEVSHVGHQRQDGVIH